MRSIRMACIVCAFLLAACLFASCKGEPAPSSSGEESAALSSASDPSVEESADPSEEPDLSGEESEVSLPPLEAVVLLYTDYLTVRTMQDGLTYEYTYCFDAEGEVFNAVAVIRFPEEEAAQREYDWLRMNSYPNLELDGTVLTFCFPRKECPFYGISYRALEVLLEETVYEIVDRHPPEEPDEPSDPSESEET